MSRTRRSTVSGKKILPEAKNLRKKRYSKKEYIMKPIYKTSQVLKHHREEKDAERFCNYIKDRFKIIITDGKYENAVISIDDYRKYKGVFLSEWVIRFKGDSVILSNYFYRDYENKFIGYEKVVKENTKDIPSKKEPKDIKAIKKKKRANKKLDFFL